MSLRIGVIGAGNMGRNHIRIVKELTNRCSLSGVYDPIVGKNDLADTFFEGVSFFESENELIDASDAIIIAAPSSLHKELALKCAAKKKHTLVEKPLALSAKDAREIVTAFEGNNTTLMVGHVEQFNPVVIELEKILNNEEIVAIQIERCSSKDLRIQDTDVVFDLMIHDFDILINTLVKNKTIRSISALGTRVYSKENMDYVNCVLQFENGVVASVVGSRITEDKIRKIRIHCEHCYIEADLLNRTLTISRKTVMNLDVGYLPIYRQENIVEKVFISNEEPLKAELKHFCDSIEAGVTPQNNGRSALDSIEVLDKVKGELYK